MAQAGILQKLIAPDGVTEPRFLAARSSFWAYCKLRNPKFFKDSRRYLSELADTLQKLVEGRLINPKTGKPVKKLMINIPPRHGKSYILTLFCEWCFGRDNGMQIISVSYNEKLASRFARAVRDDIDAEKIDPRFTIFNDVFPGTHIKDGDAAMQMWSLDGSFFSYLATGFGGTITGIGCKLGIIDDPIKSAEEAYNDNVLEAQWDWYGNTFLQRVEEGGLQIINHTRWSTKDLCGKILASDEADDWYVFSRSAYNEDTDSMLCEELLSRASYESKRGIMRDAIADANYQQQPVDIKGCLYTSFAIYDKPPAQFERVISYTDTADTGSDKLCSIVAGVFEGRGYVLDLIHTDKPMEQTEPEVAAQLHNNGVQRAKIESNNGGRGFARSVERLLWERHKNRRVHVDWFHQSENKQARILAGSSFVMRNILYPADWRSRWREYAADMSGYQAVGRNRHDDAPDATTGLAEMLQGKEKRKLRTMNRSLLGL